MQYGVSKSFYIDIVTIAGSIYELFEIDVVVPFLESDNEQPLVKICSVELVYAGKFSSCVRKHVFDGQNNQAIEYANEY